MQTVWKVTKNNDHIRVNLLLYKKTIIAFYQPSKCIVLISRNAVTLSRIQTLRAFSQLSQHQNITWSSVTQKLTTVREILLAKSVKSKKNLLFILNHIQQKIPFNSFSIGFDRIFSSLSEALKNVFQMNRSNIGIRWFTVCPRGRAHLESEYESVYSGTWVERFLCFNHFLIYQGPKYAVMLVVFLPSVHWNKILVSEYAKYRYCVTGNFVDKSLAVSGLMISEV